MMEFADYTVGTGSPPPPHTRMLLSSDGSTTVLLQALMGERLQLRLDGLATIPAGDVPAYAREHLRAGADEPVMVRRSALVTGAGVEVSRNEVIGMPSRSPVASLVLTSSQPIGWTMNGGRAGHSRASVTAGSALWEVAEGSIACACKSYVIVDGGEPLMFITERFNPTLVPLDRSVVERQ